ncbi:hypothetical protein [Amycolatopsis antarctica]|uniref:hypothetical protein n=1 Tax=Amycolatopsis antarctica TaxID=1854586 RepID=UPI00105685B5|nr:hypothetical protein [Amycolatopsis antarctica]
MLGDLPAPSDTQQVTGGGVGPGAVPGAAHDVEAEVKRTREEVQGQHGPWSTSATDSGLGSGINKVLTTGDTKGGQFVFDAEQITAKLAEWEKIKGDIDTNVARLREAARLCEPPSHDPPAVGQAEATRRSMLVGVDHAQSMADYAQAFIDSLRMARDGYVAREETNTDAMGKTGVEEDGGSTGIYGG